MRFLAYFPSPDGSGILFLVVDKPKKDIADSRIKLPEKSPKFRLLVT